MYLRPSLIVILLASTMSFLCISYAIIKTEATDKRPLLERSLLKKQDSIILNSRQYKQEQPDENCCVADFFKAKKKDEAPQTIANTLRLSLREITDNKG